ISRNEGTYHGDPLVPEGLPLIGRMLFGEAARRARRKAQRREEQEKQQGTREQAREDLEGALSVPSRAEGVVQFGGERCNRKISGLPNRTWKRPSRRGSRCCKNSRRAKKRSTAAFGKTKPNAWCGSSGCTTTMRCAGAVSFRKPKKRPNS